LCTVEEIALLKVNEYDLSMISNFPLLIAVIKVDDSKRKKYQAACDGRCYP
jgi:hypothetical protein